MASEHEPCMRLALALALEAAGGVDAPVGAVVVHQGKVVGAGRNRKTSTDSGIAHAELEALQLAVPRMGRRPAGAVLYSTLEPCPMCLVAAAFCSIECVVYGTADPLGGGVALLRGHPYYGALLPRLVAGALHQECTALLEHPAMAELRRAT